ncbi:choline/carnitine O-acyltransferase [Lawsonibacter sp.]|uniref:choline/carnitine O-acyltransferase n=1 Tax=Lawsonibacter sp. TaxID=2185275 RepID=UPI002586140F|nr:choline/carnitine O-acyltransferase [Lawsonibacter sp.]MCI6398959.1 choline/carnitine O-acyltransferase [Lawsonibacter sp.]
MDCIKFNLSIKNNAGLPHYPNPGLRDTLERYLNWLEPLVTKEELAQAINEVDAFQALEQFPRLERKMDELAEGSDDSYIYNYWVKGHLGFRDPICPYTSVPILYDNPTLRNLSQAEKAAALLFATAETYRVFRQKGNGAYNIGPKTYSNDELFGALASINHIAHGQDVMYISDEISRHSLVLYKNHIYTVEVITPEGKPIPYGNLRYSVAAILNDATPGLEVNFNTVTSEPERDMAGDLLAGLLAIPGNAEEYEVIKKAIAVVNLDTCAPETVLQKLYTACGDPLWFNRFHGKGTQFNVAVNGAMSMIVEHTYCDGGIEVYLVKRVGEILGEMDLTAGTDQAAYRELQFHLDSFEDRLRQCFARFRSKMSAFDARVVSFPGLSRTVLREHGILSGDGFMHIAFQAAQQMAWNDIRNTYISVDCRKFFRGRTEVNRPVTHASKAFVAALLDDSVSKEERRRLMLAALDAHHERTRQAQAGMGVNRYLFAVREVCKDYAQELGFAEQPAFFRSKGFARICEDRLSCTSFGNDDMKGCYFPPVMPHGLGIFYHIDEEAYAIITMFLEDGDMLDRFDENLHTAIAKILES